MATKKNQNTESTKKVTNNNSVSKKEEKTMAKKANEIQVITEEQMDNMMAEGYQMDVVNDSDEQVILKKGRTSKKYIIKEWQKSDNKKATKKVTEDGEEKAKQVHIARDRDIKIDSKKVGQFGVKIIYHRLKDGEKQYRIFIAYKNEEGKLVRTRLVNDNIKAIQSNEEKMVAYFNKITKSESEFSKVYKAA